MLTFNVILGYQGLLFQRAKKVVSDSQGLVDFAIGLVNSVINLSNGQVKSFAEFKLQKKCEINLLIKTFLGLVEMMFGLVNVSFSLPKWQAVKMSFFAPCIPRLLVIFFSSIRPTDPISGNAFHGKRRKKRGWPY